MKFGGSYRHAAIIELTEEYAAAGKTPRMISRRAIGVKRIVSYTGILYAGKTDRCAWRKGLAKIEEEFRALCQEDSDAV